MGSQRNDSPSEIRSGYIRNMQQRRGAESISETSFDFSSGQKWRLRGIKKEISDYTAVKTHAPFPLGGSRRSACCSNSGNRNGHRFDDLRINFALSKCTADDDQEFGELRARGKETGNPGEERAPKSNVG